MFFYVFIGCSRKQLIDADKNLILNMYTRNILCKTDSLILRIDTINDTIMFNYLQGADTFRYSFSKLINNDAIIHLLGTNCSLVSEKTYIVSDEKYTVSKYFYDVENMYDEETSFFYHKKYGLLLGFNDGWMDLIFTLKYDNVSSALIDSIINDKTGFYRLIAPPPPPIL